MLTIGSAIDGAAKEIEKRWECFELGETAYRFLHETVISVQDSVTQNIIKGKTQKLHPFKEDHAALKLLSLAYLYLRKSLDSSIKNAFSNLMSREIHQVPHCQSITACEVLSTQQLKWATVLLISVPESSIVNVEVGSFVVLQYHPKNDVELLEQAFPKSLLGFVEYVMDTPHSISKESRIVISVRYCHPFYFCNLSPGMLIWREIHIP